MPLIFTGSPASSASSSFPPTLPTFASQPCQGSHSLRTLRGPFLRGVRDISEAFWSTGSSGVKGVDDLYVTVFKLYSYHLSQHSILLLRHILFYFVAALSLTLCSVASSSPSLIRSFSILSIPLLTCFLLLCQFFLIIFFESECGRDSVRPAASVVGVACLTLCVGAWKVILDAAPVDVADLARVLLMKNREEVRTNEHSGIIYLVGVWILLDCYGRPSSIGKFSETLLRF
ncbi:hypothetical protein PIB30_017612 [Stylosanthes scabra]|uniref:Transmembrane protein n=1 Tax=Stylosanthes scabra TaxID=79078 RepID=A0ABU6V730_9FABA|nr:hypothetical protein [Stylosanthes scabra]